MTDLLKTGLAWLNDKRTDFASVACSLDRAGQEISFSGTLGGRSRDADGNDSGQYIDIWLSVVGSVSDFGDTRPEPGDTVTVDGKEYEARPPLDGQDTWEFADPYSVMLRIYLRPKDEITPAG